MKTNVKYQKFFDFPDFETLKDIVLYGAKKGQDKKQYMFYNFENEVEIKTFNQMHRDVKGLGQYLYSKGIKSGKKVAILSENSYYWIACFYSIITGSNVAIPLDPKLPFEELAELMERSRCDAIYYSSDFEQAVELMKKTSGVVIREYIKIENFYDIIEEGHSLLDSGSESYLNDTVKPEDLAVIVFTSGTTGKSKGVMLSHRNIATNVISSCKVLTGGHAIGFLPLHHAFSWVSALFSGTLITEYGFICRSIKDIQKDLAAYHPQNFAAVPLAVETIYKKIWYTAKKNGKEDVLKKGLKISRFLSKFGIDVRRKLFKQIIDNLGGELELIICGGAYLDEKYEKGMYEFGIQIINGYGITECSPAVTCNRLDKFKFGSAGIPLPCNEIKINNPDEDGVGEIYVRGTNVMLGYYEDPEATAEAFDGDWFKTGDYGYIDEDGFLFFKGRKKNLIVLSNGKNVSPEEIEDKLSMIDYVKEVVVYDEGGYITAEFFLDTASTPDAKERIKNDVNEINKKMPMYKQVARVKTRDSEFPKTTTLKILRNYK